MRSDKIVIPMRWITPIEAAEYLKTSERNIRKLITDGLLPAKKRVIRGTGIRPHYFIRVTDADAYMDKLPDAGFKSEREEKPKHRGRRRGAFAGIIEIVR